MKKYLLTLISLATWVTHAQKPLLFESRFAAGKNYALSMIMTAQVETKYGSATGLSKLTDTLVNTATTTKLTRTLVTGEATKDNTFNAVMKFDTLEVTNNGQQGISPISGTMVYGTYNRQNVLKIDSIKNPNLDQSVLMAVKTNLENSKPEIDFPKKPMQINDSFEQRLPMNIPVNEYQISAFIQRKYTLKSIRKNSATFDVQETISLDDSQPQTDVIASGSGKGILVFDINENQVIRDESDTVIHLKALVEDLITTSEIKTRSVKNMEIK